MCNSDWDSTWSLGRSPRHESGARAAVGGTDLSIFWGHSAHDSWVQQRHEPQGLAEHAVQHHRGLEGILLLAAYPLESTSKHAQNGSHVRSSLPRNLAQGLLYQLPSNLPPLHGPPQAHHCAKDVGKDHLLQRGGGMGSSLQGWHWPRPVGSPVRRKENHDRGGRRLQLWHIN